MSSNERTFGFEIDSAIDTKYIVYESGDHIGWHTDGPISVMTGSGVSLDASWRKLSVSIALNDESEYEGGDLNLVIPQDPASCLHNIRLGVGEALFFPPFLSHNVTPITRGTRKTLVYWMCGPRWK